MASFLQHLKRRYPVSGRNEIMEDFTFHIYTFLQNRYCTRVFKEGHSGHKNDKSVTLHQVYSSCRRRFSSVLFPAHYVYDTLASHFLTNLNLFPYIWHRKVLSPSGKFFPLGQNLSQGEKFTHLMN